MFAKCKARPVMETGWILMKLKNHTHFYVLALVSTDVLRKVTAHVLETLHALHLDLADDRTHAVQEPSPVLVQEWPRISHVEDHAAGERVSVGAEIRKRHSS